MERLTHPVATINGKRQYAAANYQRAPGGNKQDFINALGLYEDTGLEPEELTELIKAEQKRREGCEYCDNHAYVIHIEYDVPAHMNYCYACGRDLRGES